MKKFVFIMLSMLSLNVSAQEEETCFCGKKVECVSAEFANGKEVFDMAIEYQKQGLPCETLFAMWQASCMGEEERVNDYVMNNKDFRKIIEIGKLLDSTINLTNEQFANYLDTCGIANDREMCIFAEVIRHSDLDKNITQQEIAPLFESIKQKYPDNLFAVYVETNYAYEDNEEKQACQYKMLADKGYVLAYSGLAGCYFAGIGVETDHQKAAEYYQKAFNAGMLVKHGSTRYKMLLDIHPECRIPDVVYKELCNLKEVSFANWLRQVSQMIITE